MKPSIIEFLAQAHEEERAFLASLSAEERSASGSLHHWSAKDLTIHLAVWKERVASILSAAVRGDAPPKYGDTDTENAAIFDQHRNLPWEGVHGMLEQAEVGLIERVQTLRDQELGNAQWLTGRMMGQPLWRGIVMGGFWHPILHLSEFYYKRGDAERLNEIAQRAAERLGRLDESPVWRGRMIYDLACYYALTRQKEKAIAKLREALQVYPGLTEWSKQDTDLIAIRDDPTYKALYAR